MALLVITSNYTYKALLSMQVIWYIQTLWQPKCGGISVVEKKIVNLTLNAF